MNKNDRAELAKARELIEQAMEILETLKDQEQEKFDNLSEGLQASERGQKFEMDAARLADAHSSCESAISEIDEVE